MRELFPYEFNDPWVGGEVFEQVGLNGIAYTTRLEADGIPAEEILKHAVIAGKLPPSRGSEYVNGIKAAFKAEVCMTTAGESLLQELLTEIAREEVAA